MSESLSVVSGMFTIAAERLDVVDSLAKDLRPRRGLATGFYKHIDLVRARCCVMTPRAGLPARGASSPALVVGDARIAELLADAAASTATVLVDINVTAHNEVRGSS